MKRLITIITFGLFLNATAQTVKYTVVKNEPIEPKISVNLDLFHLDGNSSIKNMRVDNMSFNIGVFGYVKLIDILEVDFNIHKSWLTVGNVFYKDYPGHLEINTGINFLISNRTKSKKTKVILKVQKTSTTTTTNYIMVPTKLIKRFGFRGGLYQKSGPFNYADYADISFSAIEETKISSYGAYVGLLSKTISNIIIKDPKYGRSSNSSGINLYFDALIVPINRFKDLNNNGELVSDVVHGFKKTSPFGFRFGLRKYRVEKKAFTGKIFGSSTMLEFGYKPYQGMFFQAGLGITIIKH